MPSSLSLPKSRPTVTLREVSYKLLGSRFNLVFTFGNSLVDSFKSSPKEIHATESNLIIGPSNDIWKIDHPLHDLHIAIAQILEIKEIFDNECLSVFPLCLAQQNDKSGSLDIITEPGGSIRNNSISRNDVLATVLGG